MTWEISHYRPGQGKWKLSMQPTKPSPTVVINNFERVQDSSHHLRNNKIHVAHFQKNKQHFTAHATDVHSTSLLGQSPAHDLPIL